MKWIDCLTCDTPTPASEVRDGGCECCRNRPANLHTRRYRVEVQMLGCATAPKACAVAVDLEDGQCWPVLFGSPWLDLTALRQAGEQKAIRAGFRVERDR